MIWSIDRLRAVFFLSGSHIIARGDVTMGYRIEYDGQAGKYEVKPEMKLLPKTLLCAGLLLAFLCLRPQGIKQLRSFLIPGEDAVTVQAVQLMTDDLRSGATLKEAVEAFCRYVIHGQ